MSAITPAEALSKVSLLTCKGYNPNFILASKKINITSILNNDQKKELPIVEGNKNGILNYTDLSVLFNKNRKIPFFSAYNIDGSNKVENVKRTTFRVDQRIDASIQLNKSFYDLEKKFTEFEIGHMAANNEMAWGIEAQLKAYQTFLYTNSVPQAENLNTGVWKSLETYIIKEAINDAENKKINVITGPVLNVNDPVYVNDNNFQVPLQFFKIIIFEFNTKLYATAFIMSHEKKLREDELIIDKVVQKKAALKIEQPFMDFLYSKVYQVNVEDVSKLTGMKFKWTGVKNILIENKSNLIKISKQKTNQSKSALKSKIVEVKRSNIILPK